MLTANHSLPAVADGDGRSVGFLQPAVERGLVDLKSDTITYRNRGPYSLGKGEMARWRGGHFTLREISLGLGGEIAVDFLGRYIPRSERLAMPTISMPFASLCSHAIASAVSSLSVPVVLSTTVP